MALSQILSTLQIIPHLVCHKPSKLDSDNQHYIYIYIYIYIYTHSTLRKDEDSKKMLCLVLKIYGKQLNRTCLSFHKPSK